MAASGAAQTLPDASGRRHHPPDHFDHGVRPHGPAPAAGKSFVLALKQDGTGSRTVTWPAAVLWPAAAAPTLTTAVGKTDLFSFLCTDGAHWVGVTAAQNL